jgi:hypothetical protein
MDLFVVPTIGFNLLYDPDEVSAVESDDDEGIPTPTIINSVRSIDP